MHCRFVVVVIFTVLTCVSQSAKASGIQNSVFSLIIKSLNEEINGNLDAETIEFSPPSTVIFREVIVRETNGHALFSAKKIRAQVRIGDLFSGALNFDEIEILAPRMDLRFVNGRLNLLSLFKTGNPETPPLQFGKLIIKGGQATFKDNQNTIDLQNIDIETDSFDTDFKKIVLKKMKGVVSAPDKAMTANIDGTLTSLTNSKANETQLTYRGKVKSLQAFERKIDDATLSTTVLLGHDDIRIKNLNLASAMMNMVAQGTYQLATKQISLTVNGRMPQTGPFFKDLDTKWNLKDAIIRASVNGDVSNPLIIADIESQWRGNPLHASVKFETESEKIVGELTMNSESEVDLEPIISKDLTIFTPKVRVFANGTLKRLSVTLFVQATQVKQASQGVALFGVSANAKADIDTRLKSFSGDFTLDFNHAQMAGLTISTSHVLSNLHGSLDALTAKGSLRAASLKTKVLDTGKLESKFEFKNDEFTFNDLTLGIGNGVVKIRDLTAQITGKKLAGRGVVENIDLLKMGDLNAQIVIGGTTEHPQITLDGKVDNVKLLGSKLAAVDFIATFGQAAKGVLQVSAGIDDDRGKLNLQASVDTRSRQVNALLEFMNIEADPVLAKFDPWLKFGQSAVSGELEVTGSLDNPNAKLSFALNADRADAKMNLLGMNATMELKDHKLSFGAIANLLRRAEEYEPSFPAVPIQINGEGSFRSFDDFSLHYDASMQSDSFEKVSDFLKRESIFLDMKLSVTGNVEKKPSQNLKYSLSATVTDLNALLPNDLPLKLEKPFVFSLANNTFVIKPKAHFLLNDGEFTLGGQFSAQKVDAEFEGRIPLYFARFFNRSIVDTTGVATGNLTLSGSIDNPLIKGSLKPEKGSLVKLRSVPSNIEFESGELRASLIHGDKGSLVRIDIDDLKTKIGTGRLSVAGTLDLNGLSTAQAIAKTDVTLIGSDLSLVQQNFAIEGGFNLRVITENNTHFVRGVAEIVSGRIFKEFKLDGFEINAVTVAPKEFNQSDFFKLFKLKIDVDLSPFDLEADFGPFDFLGSLAGDNLHISGDLTQPRIFGDLVLSDGVFKFPAADFEIPTTPIALRNTPSKAIDPDIHIKATSELGQDFGFTENTAVELSLDGNLDSLNLGLSPSSGERQLDRQKILGILLNINFGPEILLRPIFGQLEDILKAKTKTRIRIASSLSAGGVRTVLDWRLNTRLEIGGSWSTGQLGLEDVHFKLKLFDHLPIGKELSLEGIFSLIEEQKRAQNLQLNYRLFEK